MGNSADPTSLDARRIRRVVNRGGLHAFEASYAPGSSLPIHSHAEPLFTYVVRGGFTELASGSARECSRGSAIFRAAGESHANDVSAHGTTSLNVTIDPESWQALATDGTTITGRVLSGDVERIALIVWREFHRDDDASTLAISEAVALLCAYVHDDVRRSNVCGGKLKLAAEYIAERLVPVPGLTEVANVVGVHPMYLARLFRRRFGYSMGEFVRRRRIEWALGELADGDLTIATIAVRAGFADHAHFTRTFRRLTGCTPTWYRHHAKAVARPRL